MYFEIEGIGIDMDATAHALQRMKERNVYEYAAYGSVIAIGEDLLDMRNGEEFCIMDKDLDISIVCAIHTSGLSITIDVITVLDNSMFYVKQGTRVFKLN